MENTNDANPLDSGTNVDNNNWTSDLDLYIKNIALDCYQRSLMHNFEANKCHNYNWWINMLIIAFGSIITILQIITIVSSDITSVLAWAISTIGINMLLVIITELSYFNQYGLQESIHIKTSADYELIYQNILMTMSQMYKYRRHGNEYSVYITNTSNRIKTNSPHIPLKIQEKYEEYEMDILNHQMDDISVDIPLDDQYNNNGKNNIEDINRNHNSVSSSESIMQNRLRSMESKKVISEIENRIKENGTSAHDSWEMHRFLHNL